jgi:peptide/nickel transport system permease protein
MTGFTERLLGYAPPPRAVDWSILACVLFAIGSGLYSFTVGRPDGFGWLFVLLTFFETGFYTAILVIGLILWRAIARILRSQVLQLKERQYIMAAKTSGASTPRIIAKHIIPNVASMAALFFAMGIGLAILKQAGLAFLGMTDPFLPAWGTMIRNAYDSGLASEAWWWTLSPGVMISITVLSVYLIGRGYEATGGQDAELG